MGLHRSDSHPRQTTRVNIGMSATLEGEPPGEPDQGAASAKKPFSRTAGEGGRRPDVEDRAKLKHVDHACKHRHECDPGGQTSSVNGDTVSIDAR